MRSYFKEVTVESEARGSVISRTVLVCVYPVFTWFDSDGIYHELLLFESDLELLSQLHILVDDVAA
jgi:hypothetical protein